MVSARLKPPDCRFVPPPYPASRMGSADYLMRSARTRRNIPYVNRFMIERREEHRITSSDLVLIGWHDGVGKLSQLGNVEDLSLSGMGILVYDDVPLDTRVTVTYGFGELGGTVKHTSTRETGIFVGIEFDEVSKNSILHFQPELLIREV